MDTASNDEWALVGARIRSARENQGMSMRELARRIDVSASHVSQVERGLASFSVRSLYTVAGVLDISMDSLFEPEDSEREDVAVPDAAIPGTSPLDDSAIVQRAGRRPSITLASGPRWERLTPRPEAFSEFIEVIYEPASPGAEPPEEFVRHDGREYGVITKGTLTVQVGFDTTILGEGDSIAFDSSVPHRFWNTGTREVRAIWFVLDRGVDGDSTTPVAAASPRLVQVTSPGVV